jgi:N-methylhydantoinase A
MCFQGQRHEIGITLPDGPVTHETLAWLRDELARAFVKRYHYAPRDGRPQLVNLRVFARELGHGHEALLAAAPQTTAPVLAAREPGRRRAYFPDAPEGVDTPLYDRDSLAVNKAFYGPAIVEEDFSTVVVPPGHRCTALTSGDLLIETLI